MLYFRGCTAREKETDIADATEKLLELANIDYEILEEEKCCGSVLFRTGFEKKAQDQIKKNIKLLKNKKILTSCAGCYKTLSQDYEALDVIHISDLLDYLIKENKLNFKFDDTLKVTYHDSCHLGRHCNKFDSPRNVISKVSNLIEMKNNRDNGLCCGAGGGVKSAYSEIADELSIFRINQAKDVDADILITACPFCKVNLKDKGIEVLDLTEFLIKYGDIE